MGANETGTAPQQRPVPWPSTVEVLDMTTIPDQADLALVLLRRLVKAGTINRIGDAICNEDEHDLFILTPAEQYLLRTIEED